MRNLLVEVDADGICVSRMWPTKGMDQIDFVYSDKFLCWLEILAQGRSFGDAIKAITEQAELAQREKP